MIKYAVMTPSLGQPGGAERTILIQLRYADPDRMQCTGIALAGCGPLDEALGRELRRHVGIYGDAWTGPRRRPPSPLVDSDYPDLAAALRRACRDADVLVAWGSLTLGRFTAGLGIPVVCVSHCATPGKPPLTGVTHLAGVSPAARGFFDADPAAVAALPFEVIPNGVEVDRACPRRGRIWQRDRWGIAPGDKVLLYLGRQSPYKNPWSTVQTLARLPADYKLIMMGNQPFDQDRPLPRIAELVETLGLGDRVRFLPPSPFVGDALAAADCLVHLSMSEADSLVVKEAFLAGLPVVHTRVGSIPEMEAEFGPVGWGVDFQPGPPRTDSVDPDEAAARVREAAAGDADPRVDKMRRVAWGRWTGAAACERWADYLERIVAAWNP